MLSYQFGTRDAKEMAMGGLLGRLVTGALWGAGAGAALIFGREGAAGLRTAAKTLMKGYAIVAAKAAEGRETLDDLYAEAKGGASSAQPAKHQRVPVARDEAEEPAVKRRSPRTAAADGSTKPTRARSRK